MRQLSSIHSHAWLGLALVIACGGLLSAVDMTFPHETIDQWHGFKRHNFQIDGCSAWIVEPKQALPGNPWSWCLEFADYNPEKLAAPQLLAKGFYHGHIEVGNTFGCPEACKHFDAFYAAMTAKGLNKKVALIGISRGGLYAYRWASQGPQRVSVIYGDAPVCDFKSWPGGKVGKGSGSSGDWQSLLSLYHFANEAEAMAYTGNPIDVLGPLAKAHIAIIHVVGDTDTTVPPVDNTNIVLARYTALHGVMQVIHKPGEHHPHGLDDPTPVVDFILAHSPHQ
jgi:pimeloyl-ACP methyl ester carboxylesterase